MFHVKHPKVRSRGVENPMFHVKHYDSERAGTGMDVWPGGVEFL
jgi:hypothetical protein